MNLEARPRAERLSTPWPALMLIALWAWAIWSCAEHWRGNPNYSYGWVVPLLALGFGIRRYLMTTGGSLEPSIPSFQLQGLAGLLVALGLGALAFLLEYSREEMWHPQIVLWSICLLAVVSTIATLRIRSGVEVARAEIFPVFFFLTAVPWPPRLEQPITSTLMRWVARATVEFLHWLGIEAQISGAAIAIRPGLVGITEACSGIRSLQAGIMFGLAMGEWFLLRPTRRLILLLIAIVLALATNLIRTLALTLEAERHGVESLDRFHDLIGNVMITALVLAIWVIGKLLAEPSAASAADIFSDRARIFASRLFAPAPPIFRSVALILLAGILCARVVYARLEARDRTQTAPFFVARIDGSKGNKLATVPRAVWDELHATSGEYIRHESPNLPGGGADCFHFFWKPSVWNRFALVHRPDICMPGVGWESDGPAETREIEVDGHFVRFYLFRFRRQNTHALELWGAWRNGETVPIDYRPDQIFGVTAAPSLLHLEGKRRSATEIVACSIIADGVKPEPEMAVALLPSVFHYNKTNE